MRDAQSAYSHVEPLVIARTLPRPQTRLSLLRTSIDGRSNGVLFVYHAPVAPKSLRARSADAMGRKLDRPLRRFRHVLNYLWNRGFRFLYLLDSFAIFTLLCGANLARFGLDWPTYGVGHYMTGFAITIAIVIAVNYFTGLYERDPRLGLRPWGPRVALAMGLSTLVVGAFALIFDRYLMPRLNLAALFVLGTFSLTLTRVISRRLSLRREGPAQVALVGNFDERVRARPFVERRTTNAQVVLECDSEMLNPSQVEKSRATDVFFVDLSAFEKNFPEPITTLEEYDVTLIQRVSAAETLLGLKTVYQVGGVPFVRLNTQGLQEHQRRLKRITDIALILLFCPIWLPLLTLICGYSKIVSSSGVFYRQTRVGLKGKHFEIVKFRTMYPDAESSSGPRLSERNDPRVEPALRWVRTTRMDELPQLWNVIRGHMSLVGPRPERPEFTHQLERQIPGYPRRHSVSPGITGYAQVFSGYDTNAAHKLGYDLQYLVNWSLVLDIQILLRTIWVALTRRV